MIRKHVMVNLILMTALLGVVILSAVLNVLPVQALSANTSFLGLKIDSAMYHHLQAQAEENGSVRLLVQLETPFNAESMALDGAAAFEQRMQISFAQNQVTQALAGTNAEVLHNYTYIPYNLVEADAAALDVLLSLPYVHSVHEDRLSKTDLRHSIEMINADDAWTSGYTGTGQTVVILDTGVDKTHPFLSGRVVSEACYSTNYAYYSSSSVCPSRVSQSIAAGSAMPYAGNCPSGECDHGTHVAGIAAGNGSEFSGVAKDANIIAIQVFSRFDSRDYCYPYYNCALSWGSDQIKGLERVYALRNTYSIAAVNMSMGGDGSTTYCDTDPRKPIIDLLRGVGIATVISSGNDGYTNAIAYPACISSAVSVGAVNNDDYGVAEFTNSADFLSLLAPGDNIKSSLPGGGYWGMSGTSMAAPHVTGAWALIRSKYPTASVDDILNLLISNSWSIYDTRVVPYRIKPFIRISATAPRGLSAIATTTTDYVALSWYDPGNDETAFIVERRLPGGSWQQIETLAENTQSYKDYTAVCETTYEYRIIAAYPILESQSNTHTVTTPICFMTNINLTGTSQQRINMTWTDNSNIETGYRVERSPNGSSGWTQISGNLAANSTSYSDYPLLCDTPYYYRITVFNASTSRTSSIYTRATLPCAVSPEPSGMSTSPLTITAVVVSWDDVGDYETSYRVECWNGSDWVLVESVGQDVTSTTITNLDMFSTNDFRVIAVNSAGERTSVPFTGSTFSNGFLLPMVFQ